MAGFEKIQVLRDRIDDIDSQIAALLDRRASVAAEVGKIKTGEGLAIYDPRRESEVLTRVALEARTLSTDDMQLIYRCILDISRRYLERLEMLEK